jgi:hypothetical protein
MANKYTVIKHSTQSNGLTIWGVQNKATGLIKYAATMKYNAEELAKFANGKNPELAGYTAYLRTSNPAQYGVPCDQIEA